MADTLAMLEDSLQRLSNANFSPLDILGFPPINRSNMWDLGNFKQYSGNNSISIKEYRETIQLTTEMLDVLEIRCIFHMFDVFDYFTLPETNIARESLGLEDEFPFGKASWQVLCSFWGLQLIPPPCIFPCFGCCHLPSGFTVLTGSGLEEDDLLKAFELFRRAVSGCNNKNWLPKHPPALPFDSSGASPVEKSTFEEKDLFMDRSKKMKGFDVVRSMDFCPLIRCARFLTRNASSPKMYNPLLRFRRKRDDVFM